MVYKIVYNFVDNNMTEGKPMEKAPGYSLATKVCFGLFIAGILAAILLAQNKESQQAPADSGPRKVTFTPEDGEAMEIPPGGLHFPSPLDDPAQTVISASPQLQLLAEKPRVIVHVYPVASPIEPLQYRLD